MLACCTSNFVFGSFLSRERARASSGSADCMHVLHSNKQGESLLTLSKAHSARGAKILIPTLPTLHFTGCVRMGEGPQRQAATPCPCGFERTFATVPLGEFGKTSISWNRVFLHGRGSSWEGCNSLPMQNSRKSRTTGSCVCHPARSKVPPASPKEKSGYV